MIKIIKDNDRDVEILQTRGGYLVVNKKEGEVFFHEFNTFTEALNYSGPWVNFQSVTAIRSN